MSLGALSVVIVTVAFTGLLVWVLRPSNKARLEAHGSIPLRDGTPTQERQSGSR